MVCGSLVEWINVWSSNRNRTPGFPGTFPFFTNPMSDRLENWMEVGHNVDVAIPTMILAIPNHLYVARVCMTYLSLCLVAT